MAKKKYLLIFMIIWLTACTHATPIPTPTATMATSTPSTTSTASHTPTPSIIPTRTITPLPTTLTATPTFDVSSIVTVTPAPAEQCPETIPVSNPDDDLNYFHDNPMPTQKELEENVLEILNTHGASALAEMYDEKDYSDDIINYLYQDLTNDGVPEFALRTLGFYIFGCKDGHYEILLMQRGVAGLPPTEIVFVDDFNKNGVDEIVLLSRASQGGRGYKIYEWNDNNFINLLEPDIPEYPDSGWIQLEATGELQVKDIDNDGAYEMIANSGIPVWVIYEDGLPWRNERTYYKWNGEIYVPIRRDFSIPDVDFVTIQEFRFQSIQDGDLAMSQGEYAKALDLYQRAIFDDSLSGYSLEIRENLRENWDTHFVNDPTPTPYPDDSSEYPKLASYAYYRIMLLHVVQGNLIEAEKTCNTLQEEFAHDQYGAPYAEMAKEFWQAYQQNQNMTNACGAAISYAAIHPEILIPLGSDYHGWQSHTYQPADVCPFR